MGTAAKLAVALLALVVAGILFIVLQEDEGSGTTPTTAGSTSRTTGAGQASGDASDRPKPDPTPEGLEAARIVIEGGQPVGGVQELTFSKGEKIRFVVESDVTDHVHLHGYDVFQDIAAGGTAKFGLPATLEGVFEVELEDSVVPIAEITVEPS